MSTESSFQTPDSLLKLRKSTNVLMLGLSAFAAAIAISALLSVLAYLFVCGIHAINWHVFTMDAAPVGATDGGLRSSIVGTLILLAIASSIGLPIGILGGVYQVESKGKFAYLVRFLTDVLNSVPSIVVGIFIYVLIVTPTAARHPGTGFSAFAGGMALAVIMIPTIMRTTEEILRLVPITLREGALALGATRWRTMFDIVLPTARAGIVTGIMLALARIAGETAPLLFTALGNVNFSMALNKPIDALPLAIFNDASAPDDFLRRMAMAGALILIVLILCMSIITRLATSSKILEEK